MSDEATDLDGFTVGIINEPGYCEVCHHRLRVGAQAAIWRPTKELFCVGCAREVGATREPEWAAMILPVMFIAALLGSIALGLFR